MKKKAVPKPKATKQNTVFYAVAGVPFEEVYNCEIYPKRSMEEAYKDALDEAGTADLYAYEIKYLGKIKNEFKIEP
jgi:hypothetical protein